MKSIASGVAQKFTLELRKKFEQFFPPAKIEQGIALVEDVEEVLVCESIFLSKQLVLCENVPPQVDYYLVFLVFENKHYQVKSHQLYSRHTKVGILYVQKSRGIQIRKIFKESLDLGN